MKERTKKMLLIISLVLAGFTILAKTILNTDYYNIVKAINKNYEMQNPVDYKDDEPNNIDNQENTTQDETEVNTSNEQIENNNIIVEDTSTEIQGDVEETTMPSRPAVEM
ncbi:MAG: hypothetical protein E7311_00700 [Clostridiales bacterium]|nr:hypothetical protein [Clostridiales bacterium]